MTANIDHRPRKIGWQRAPREPSLVEAFASVPLAAGATSWRRFLAFLGPGYLVAVGYMDPGNWATAVAGGSRFGYALLFVALLSNVMAIVLQALCARLAIATGRDLAQACRDAYPPWISVPLWVLAELAICATDLAEVLGTAIALNLLFGLPIEIGVILTALDVFVVLWLQNKGIRWIEAFIITLLGVVAVSFAIQLAMANPDWRAVLGGFAPSRVILTDPDMLYLALGIIGATVMPHNLYLHSGIVQTRAYGRGERDLREALRFATIDSSAALLFAFLVNASLLIVAAAIFHSAGHTQVAELEQAYKILMPLLNSATAPTLFAVALLCCGINASVTATMAGQIVMEGFIEIRLPTWLRRLITRLVAILPAVIVLQIYGNTRTTDLLILSQVVLALQLPFAVTPLVLLTASRKKMGVLAPPLWQTGLASAIAVVLIALNVTLVTGMLLR